MDIKQTILKAIYGKPNAEEQEQLNNWLQEKNNRRLYEKISNHLKQEDAVRFLASVDEGKVWKKLKPHEHRRLLLAGSVAAAIAILVSVSVLQRPANKPADVQTSHATLTLSTGEVLLLGDFALSHQAADANIKVSDSLIEIRTKGHKANTQEPILSVLDIPRGESYRLTLPDGTIVQVNALSQLEFPLSFTGTAERRVRLSGEAFFEVKKDSLHPFRVETARQTITVTGTAFNVAAYPGETDKTTLCQGSVEVETGQGEVIPLTPGKQLTIDKSGNTSVQEVDTRLHTAWLYGEYYFDEQPLHEVFMELGKWFEVKEVTYTDSTLANRLFSGKLRKADGLSTIVKVIEQGSRSHIEYLDGEIRIKAK